MARILCPVTYVVEMPDKHKTMRTVHVETIKHGYHCHMTIHSVQEDQEADDQEIPDYRPSPRKAEPQIADQIQPDVKNKLLLIIEQYQLGHKLGQTSLI